MEGQPGKDLESLSCPGKCLSPLECQYGYSRIYTFAFDMKIGMSLIDVHSTIDPFQPYSPYIHELGRMHFSKINRAAQSNIGETEKRFQLLKKNFVFLFFVNKQNAGDFLV